MRSNQTILIDRSIQKIKNRYDPKRDDTAVSWVDIELLECIKCLVIKVEDLQDQINTLQDKVSK
jgi:hypothetical protein